MRSGYALYNGWMNDDFMKTNSYTPKIAQYSKYYRTFSNTVTFRTVTGEYLVAMKLMSGRQYKYDRSDVIGVLWEQDKTGNPLTIERIKQTVCNLYGSYEILPKEIAYVRYLFFIILISSSKTAKPFRIYPFMLPYLSLTA